MTTTRPTPAPETPPTVKCVVWDLDDTLWDGVLLETPHVSLRPRAADTVRELDRRGILQSVASKNESVPALRMLESVGLRGYFLHPQIHWGAKSHSLKTIATRLNLGLDAFAFVDDQPFERDEVGSELPSVLCLAPDELADWLDDPRFTPRFVTPDSARRRHMYLDEIARREAEETFPGPKEDFLASLDMRFTITPAREEDLRRAEELTVRTNQLNSTGQTYSYEELRALLHSPGHRLLIAGLRDRYGDYGKIGLALVETGPTTWTIELLLMSCRVMSRGVGNVLLGHLLAQARDAGVTLRASFVPNDRNRIMLVTYRLAGFRDGGRQGETMLLEHDLRRVPPPPRYVRVELAPEQREVRP